MDGYGNRFGLIYVDFDTLERTPKLSAEWFDVAARQNAVVGGLWSQNGARQSRLPRQEPSVRLFSLRG